MREQYAHKHYPYMPLTIYDKTRRHQSGTIGIYSLSTGSLILLTFRHISLRNHSHFAYSRFTYSRFAYDLSRFAYSNFAYSRFAYTQILPLSRFAYSSLRIKNACKIKKKCFKNVSRVSLLKVKEQNMHFGHSMCTKKQTINK